MMQHKYDESAKYGAALKTLQDLGYTYHGGEMWKPPLGQPPAYITWDGEGIPPTGVECEALESCFRLDSGEWKFIQVLFSSSEYVFAVMPSMGNRPKIFSVEEWVFRKYETPEERSARKKARACDAIVAFLMPPSNFSDAAARIYDAIAAGEIPGIPPLIDN